jgi:MFS family permease
MKSRQPLLILAVTLLIDMLGFGLILPQIPIYITHFGGKSWVGGLLLASFSTMQFIFAPIWGRVSDRWGRRPVILISLIGSAISYFSFGAATSLFFLFVARVACGVLTAASMPTSQAYIADVTPPDKRASGMAVLGAAFGLGFAFGPVIGGALSQHPVLGISPLAMPSFFAAGLAALNWIWAFFMLPESHPDRKATHEERGVLQVFPDILQALRNPTIRAQILVFAVVVFGFSAVESSFSWLVILRFHDALHAAAVYAYQAAHPGLLFAGLGAQAQQELFEKAQTAATSRIFGIVGITILFTQGAVMGGLARRAGENRLVVFGALLLTVALVGIALAPSLLLIDVLSAFIAIGNGVMMPSLNALITHSAGPQERGMLAGAQQGVGSLSRIIAPPINNYVVGVHSSIPFLSSAVLMGVAFLLSLRLKPLPHTAAARRGRHAADSSAEPSADVVSAVPEG